MEDKESRTHQQDDLLSEQPTNIEGYPKSTSRTIQSMHSHSPTQQLPDQKQVWLYKMQQQRQQQLQQAPLQPRYLLPQRQQLGGQEDVCTAGQQQFGILSSNAVPLLPSYRGFSTQSSLSTIAGGDTAQMSSVASGGEGNIRSAFPGGTRDPEHFPLSLYSRHLEQNFHEQQQRWYEQQPCYYREANMQRSNTQGNQHHQHVEPYGSPYRHSTYSGVYGAVSQVRPPPIARHQQVQQLQTHCSLNSGPMPQNRSPAARDQLPTASSPSIFSAIQPAPIFPELPEATSRATNNSSISTLNNSKSKESPSNVVNGTSCIQSADCCVSRHPNQKSTYSTFAAGLPATAENIVRPLSVIQEPISRFTVSPTGASSLPARPGSNPHSTSKASIVQARPKPGQVHSYSRQVTLSNIPPNEEVPPIPGKITSKTGKARIQLTFDRPFFNAGGELSGRLEIQCSSSRSVMLADMTIELLGYEALTKDHLAPKVFHKTTLRLQDMRHPSQAVQENTDPDADGYWMARKGRTIFPFRLNIQDLLPNSYDSKLGQVRYVASAIALAKANQHKEILNHTREVLIYETWTTDDIAQARRISVKADTSKRLFMGGESSLEMYAELTRTMVSSGGIVYVNVGVKNLTKKKIMGIKLSLWRHITASQNRSSMTNQPPTLNVRDQDSVKNYSEVIYKGEDYAFDSDGPRTIVLPVYIPSGVYSLRNTSFLHAQFFVQVSLMASMNKALAVELPVYITHASSWSDPPPRAPKDFAFPMHEDEPVKKNKSGVFSKKKSCPVSNFSNGSGTHIKKSPVDGGSSSKMATSSSTHLSMANMSTALEVPSRGMSNSRPITRRSPLKDPDSPTSVLEFSQAGNLFVVNPDTSSTTATKSDVRPIHGYPETTRSTVSTCIPQSDAAMSTSPSMDAPTSLPLTGNIPSEVSDESDSAPGLGLEFEPEQGLERELMNEGDYENPDFGMRRLLIAPSAGSSKKENDRNSSKLGLRKTLAKLSISIPSHNSSSSSLSTTPGVSPRVLPTTPRSANSITMESPDEMTSTGSRSPAGVGSLSRQSSGSSLGSLKHVFESHSRRSSIGSTRVMTVSPGPMSPNTHMLKMSKYPLSGSSSPALSPSSSIASISSPSCTSSPTLYPSTEFLKEGILGEGYQEIGHLSMTPTDVDVRLQESAPPMELSGPDEYSEYGKVKSRSPTLSPSDGKIAINQRPSRRPETQHNDAALKVNFGMTGPYDIARTTQGVRDEYYSKRSVQSRNISTKSFETCATSQRSENRSAQCSTTNQVYELVGAAARPNSAERPRQQKQVEYDAQSLDKTERHELQMLADGQMKHTQRHRQFNAQQTFQQENSLNASAYAVGVRSYSTSSKTPLIQMNAVPIESRQDPSYNHNGHYIQDLHRMPFQSLSEHRSWPSPSHYQPSQYSMKPRSLTPQSPKLEQTQRASLSCPSSPMASSHLSHISSMKHSRASSNPEFNIVLERVFPQPYRKSHMQTQDPIQFDEEISQRLYNTPLFSKNDGAVDICHDCRPAFTAAIPRPTTQHTMESKYSGKKEYEGSCSNLEVQSGQLSQKATCSDPRHFLHKQWHTEGVHAQRQHRSHETRDTDPVLIAHGETESCLGSMMQPESTQHANQIDQAPCGSHQQPSPQLVCVAEPITNRDEVSAAVIHHENSHINTDKNGQPQSANLTAESVTVASSLQAHSEVVSGGQCQRAGVCHMASRPAVEDSSCIARPLQPNANNPAVERINGSYQTSPLAFEGNMMTANSSPPPPPETARCIADVGESAAPCRTPFVPPLAVDDDLGVGRSSDPKGDH